MPRIVPVPGVEFELLGQPYVIRKNHATNGIEIENLGTGMRQTLLQDEMRDAFFSGSLTFAVAGRNTIPRPGKVLRVQYEWPDFRIIESKRRRKAYVRYRIVLAYLRLPRGSKTDKSAVEEVAEKVIAELRKTQGNQEEPDLRDVLDAFKIPGWRTVIKWVGWFLDSGGDIRSLVDSYRRCGAKGKSRVDPLVFGEIEKVIDEFYLTEDRPSVAATRRELEKRIDEINNNPNRVRKLKLPAYGTLNLRIMAIPEYEKVLKRWGKRKAEEFFRVMKTDPNRVKRILERLLGDHTVLDLFCVDRIDRYPIGRPVLSFWEDALTSYAMGFYCGFEPAGFRSAMAALLHAILPKTYVQTKYPGIQNPWLAFGVPENVAIDGAREFRGDDFEEAALSIGFIIMDLAIGSPHLKGQIERFFRTLNQMLLHELKGYAPENLKDRRDYDPMKNAVIDLDAFMAILHFFICDIYNADVNRGTGRIRARHYEEGMKSDPPAYPPNRGELAALIGNKEERTIQRRGIQLFKLFYSHARLARLRKGDGEKSFIIRYDSWNLSRIWLWVERPQKKDEDGVGQAVAGEYVEIPAEDEEYTKNLTLFQHNAVLDLLRKEGKEVNSTSLIAARKRIQAILEEQYAKSALKGKLRKAIARALNRDVTQSFEGSDDETEGMEEETEHYQPPDVSGVDGLLDEAGEAKEFLLDDESPDDSPAHKTDPSQRQGTALEDLDVEGWGAAFSSSPHTTEDDDTP